MMKIKGSVKYRPLEECRKSSSLMKKERKELEAKFLSYLSCGEVEKWRNEHREELEALYRVAEEEMEKKKRNGCLPKKPKWAVF